MIIRADLPTVIAFRSESLRYSLKHLTRLQTRRVLQALKECLIYDQSFFDASLMRDAEQECAAKN